MSGQKAAVLPRRTDAAKSVIAGAASARCLCSPATRLSLRLNNVHYTPLKRSFHARSTRASIQGPAKRACVDRADRFPAAGEKKGAEATSRGSLRMEARCVRGLQRMLIAESGISSPPEFTHLFTLPSS